MGPHGRKHAKGGGSKQSAGQNNLCNASGQKLRALANTGETTKRRNVWVAGSPDEGKERMLRAQAMASGHTDGAPAG